MSTSAPPPVLPLLTPAPEVSVTATTVAAPPTAAAPPAAAPPAAAPPAAPAAPTVSTTAAAAAAPPPPPPPPASPPSKPVRYIGSKPLSEPPPTSPIFGALSAKRVKSELLASFANCSGKLKSANCALPPVCCGYISRNSVIVVVRPFDPGAALNSIAARSIACVIA